MSDWNPNIELTFFCPVLQASLEVFHVYYFLKYRQWWVCTLSKVLLEVDSSQTNYRKLYFYWSLQLVLQVAELCHLVYRSVEKALPAAYWHKSLCWKCKKIMRLQVRILWCRIWPPAPAYLGIYCLNAQRPPNASSYLSIVILYSAGV